MALYNEDREWQVADYSIRRSITLYPDTSIPGQESRCFVKLPKSQSIELQGSSLVTDLNGPIKSYRIVPLNSDYEYIVFEISNPILNTNTDYYLYYGSKFKYAEPESAPFYLDPELDLVSDFPDQNQTKWSFTKPTIDWSDSESDKSGATATFAYVGHTAILTLACGLDYGDVKVTLESDVKPNIETIVSCYATSESNIQVDLTHFDQVAIRRIRLEVLGTRAPYSSGNKIKVIKMDYHQMLEGVLGAEEILADASFNYNSGQ